MFYVTGDIHGDAFDLRNRCVKNNLTDNDTVIVVGDVGANYFLDERDIDTKTNLQKIKPTIFCVHGNHEARPETISSYKTKEWNGGIVYYEPEYPKLLFAKDGEIYNLDGKQTLVCGGAYSVDKYYRAWYASLRNPLLFSIQTQRWLNKLANGNYILEKDAVDRILDDMSATQIHWWNNEQPNEKSKEKCLKELENKNWNIDIILTHTCPLKFEPTEMFLNGVNQDLVDKTTEEFLNQIEEKTNYSKWYAGHYHTNKKVNDYFQFLYKDLMPL